MRAIFVLRAAIFFTVKSTAPAHRRSRRDIAPSRAAVAAPRRRAMRSVYREAALGASLKAALEGLVREEHLTPNLIEETMKSYDHQLLAIDLKRDWSATANSSRPQWLHGSIEKGQLSEYNIVDGVVTFKLLQADFEAARFPIPTAAAAR